MEASIYSRNNCYTKKTPYRMNNLLSHLSSVKLERDKSESLGGACLSTMLFSPPAKAKNEKFDRCSFKCSCYVAGHSRTGAWCQRALLVTFPRYN